MLAFTTALHTFATPSRLGPRPAAPCVQNIAALPIQRSVAPVLQLASDSILTAQMRREMASEPRLADFAVTGNLQFVRHTAEDDPTKPLLIYLPGIELSGYSLHRQLPGLAEDFCVRWLAVPPDDRSSFEALREAVTREVESEEGRPIYLLGESFGGVLALSVAQAHLQ